MSKPTAPKLMAHQRASIAHARKQPLVLDTSDAGTGKTAVRITRFAERRRKGGGRLLVFAPRSILFNAWLKDFQTFAPDMKVVVATAANRARAFAEEADAYITNHDAAKWLVKQPKAFLKALQIDEIGIDESTAYKHHTSGRSRAAGKLMHQLIKPTYRWLATATPNSNTICDVWHQVYLLDGGRRLGPSFYGFRNSVCEPTQVGRNVNAVQWHDKDGAEEAVFGLLQDIVIRHRREDCTDLPAFHQYTIDYELSPAQLTAYRTLEDTSLLVFQQDLVKERLSGKPAKLTAVNAAAVATKLLQIASGAVYDGSGKYQVVDTERYELVLDKVEEVPHALVLFLWEHQRDQLVKEAEKRGLTFCVLDGKTSDAERTEHVKNYQAGWYRVMFAHPRTAGHGLTLTRGTRTIWASPTYDLEIFSQASRRQHRIGQTQKTENIVVIAKNTIEEKVYHELLMNKDARMANLLDLFATMKK